MAAAAILDNFEMAISPQRLTIYLYSTHRAVIFAIAQLSCILIDQVSYMHVKSSSIEAKIFSLSLGLVAKSSQVKSSIRHRPPPRHHAMLVSFSRRLSL